MSKPITSETLSKIEAAVPLQVGTSAVDVWKTFKGTISHQSVKVGLKQLAERGRLLRTQEVYQSENRGSPFRRYVYRRVFK